MLDQSSLLADLPISWLAAAAAAVEVAVVVDGGEKDLQDRKPQTLADPA